MPDLDLVYSKIQAFVRTRNYGLGPKFLFNLGHRGPWMDSNYA